MRRTLAVFAITGVLATGCHAAVASVLITRTALSPVLANGAAFLVALLLSFSGNTLFGFRQRMTAALFARFAVVSLLGLVLTMLIAGAAEAAGLHFLLGIALVVTTVPAVTFLLHRVWTYRS